MNGNGNNCSGRWEYLLDWTANDKWFLSIPGNKPTRVIVKYQRSPNEDDAVVKVVINPSILYPSKWSPIIEINKETFYLNGSEPPHMKYEWYDSIQLAKLAAFEYLWPTDMVDWEGVECPYYEDLDYLNDYYEWMYGHPPP